MEATATQELIYQTIAIILSIGLTAIGVYVKKFITTKIDITKYGFENERVERILDNAINYAEAKAHQVAKEKAETLAGNVKLKIARRYIDKIDPAIIMKYGDQLDDMITRKVVQVLK